MSSGMTQSHHSAVNVYALNQMDLIFKVICIFVMSETNFI